VRTTFPFLRQRLRKSVKIKEEKLEYGTHERNPSTLKPVVPSNNFRFIDRNATSGAVAVYAWSENIAATDRWRTPLAAVAKCRPTARSLLMYSPAATHRMPAALPPLRGFASAKQVIRCRLV
jgi:hypothetical protein